MIAYIPVRRSWGTPCGIPHSWPQPVYSLPSKRNRWLPLIMLTAQVQKVAPASFWLVSHRAVLLGFFFFVAIWLVSHFMACRTFSATINLLFLDLAAHSINFYNHPLWQHPSRLYDCCQTPLQLSTNGKHEVSIHTPSSANSPTPTDAQQAARNLAT